MPQNPQDSLDISLDMALDLKKVRAEAFDHIQRKMKDQALGKISAWFYDPHNSSHQHFKPTDPDTGLMTKKINDALTEIALDPKWDAWIKHRGEEIYQQALEEAMKKRAAHQANKVVFASVVERTDAECI